VIAPVESRILRGPDDHETFEWAPGKWSYGPGPDRPITGMKVFTPAGPVQAKWGDAIHRYSGGIYLVGEVDAAVARRAVASVRAMLAPRCEECGAFIDRDWHEDQTCRPGKGCDRPGVSA
jgi:hypothetical protein